MALRIHFRCSFITASLFPSLLLLLYTAGWTDMGVEGKPMKITLTVTLPNGENITKSFDTDEAGLKEMNLTKEAIENSVAKADADGKLRQVMVGSRRIPIYLNIWRDPAAITYSYVTINESYWFVSRLNYTNVTMDDFKDDPTLKPLQVSLDWSLDPAANNMLNLSLRSDILTTSVDLNNLTILHRHTEGKPSIGPSVFLVPYTGIYLRVLNPYTGLITLQRHFNTDEYFADEELLDIVSMLQDDRIAMLTTFYDVSGRLGFVARLKLALIGSFGAEYLRFRDCWAWIWQVGRGTLGEAIVPNPKGPNSIPKPLQLDVNIAPPDPAGRMCKSWPRDDVWMKRRHFCDRYEGYADLCSCSRPFQPPLNYTKTETWREHIGIVILAGDRSKYLYRLLKQILSQPGVKPNLIFASVDGPQEESIKLLELFSLKYNVHQPEGKATPRISRHLRFALFKAMDNLQVDKFIILEDDLILAPDFYSYMQQTSVILDKDHTVYSVSAYSHFSYDHTATDTTRLLRVHSLPSYGWMVKRSFLVETLPMWPPVFVATDWDYWMGSGLVRRGREVIIPEISRTSHAGVGGAHFTGFLKKRRFSNKPISSDPHTLVNLTSVDVSATEAEIIHLLNKSTPLNVTDPYNFSFPKSNGEVGVIFVKFKREEDVMHLRVLNDALGVWNQDIRDHHFGLWRLPYYQAMLLVVGVPYSKYSYYFKSGYTLFKANEEMIEKMDDNFYQEQISFNGHLENDYASMLGIQINTSQSSNHQDFKGSQHLEKLQQISPVPSGSLDEFSRNPTVDESFSDHDKIFSYTTDISDNPVDLEFSKNTLNLASTSIYPDTDKVVTTSKPTDGISSI